jgi:hypothetical protein
VACFAPIRRATTQYEITSRSRQPERLVMRQ